jgi:hypothetical protein
LGIFINNTFRLGDFDEMVGGINDFSVINDGSVSSSELAILVLSIWLMLSGVFVVVVVGLLLFFF